jgi:putative nucleotidyltransferase with HDIG domain
MSAALADVVRQIRDLPSLSAVVVELMSSIDNEETDVRALGQKIALDQALTAKTLRLANSSFYGMSTKVTTIDQAISVLGFHSIRTLVTACAVTSSFSASDSRVDFQAFWRHSVACAVCAKLLASHLKLNPAAAFTAGLLHDIGTLILANQLPEPYARMLAHRAEHDCTIVLAEQAVFGFDHAAAGAALCAYWKFPVLIQDAVAQHHQADGGGAPTLALAVHAANTIAHALDLSEQEDDLAPPMSHAVYAALALSDSQWDELLAATEATHRELCQILLN